MSRGRIRKLQILADDICNYPDSRQKNLQLLETQLETDNTLTLEEWNTAKKYKYKWYLEGRAWRKLVTEVRIRDKNVCTSCLTGKPLNTHHLTYARRYKEDIDDLITLCRVCHIEAHGWDPEKMPKRKRRYRKRKT